jgi:hypothetical protein
MVCLELVQVTGRFTAIVIASKLIHCRAKALGNVPRRGSHRKSSTVQALTTLSARPVLGRSWQTCTEAGSLPVKNSVMSKAVAGFGARAEAALQQDDVRLWPESCTFFGQNGTAGIADARPAYAA